MSRLSIYLALSIAIVLLVRAAHPGKSLDDEELISTTPEEITTGSISRDKN
ncbi:hypothetical protein [Paramesorhizobium deserti]|uniref:hypothetical protein n=1 Tax=Paramesorhizobium deserti TaxID=1494590 RepID=UPI001379D7E0|nr:hypothetical protein [Paramesorhizobium deserti]